MEFALGGAAGVEALERADVDLVISDMRMPTVSGVDVLRSAKRLRPEAVRIALSGQADTASTLEVVTLAHQFLSKPCDEGVIEATIERALALHELLTSSELRAAVGDIDRLPTRPRIFEEVLAALSDPRSSSGEISALISQDLSLAARLLQLVNSSFFATARRCTRVEEAVKMLGHNVVRDVVLVLGVYRLSLPEGSRLCLTTFEEHSILVATLAARMWARRPRAEDLYTSALLHDIGVLVRAVTNPSALEADLAEAHRRGATLGEVEAAEGEVSHAKLGAYLLGIWGFPLEVVELVAYAGAPSACASESRSAAAVIFLADALICGARREASPRLSDQVLLDARLSEPLEHWVSAAKEIVAQATIEEQS
jgi:HD-like signal output (HDOD) protein